MEKEFTLFGKDASNLIGALGEIIAWDTLRKIGIWAYKIGTWGFFPEGYPYWRKRVKKWCGVLTKEQARFLEKKEQNQISEFDFIGFKCNRFAIDLNNDEPNVKGVEGVYLIEVKTGRGANIRYYIKNPMRAFSPENLEKAKRIGFKVVLIIVELLENWKCRINYREL